jgi:YfiH family protein
MLETFTDRSGGVSQGVFASFNLGEHVSDDHEDVQANRALLASKYGPVQFMNQVHGSRIVIVESVTDEAPTADALVTGIAGVTLAVMVADCIPLLLTSIESVAAVHVGRRGLLNGVAVKTVELMREMGASKIRAVLGPAICGRCYEVSQEVHDEVVALHPLASARTAAGTPALDLPKALKASLAAEGISEISDLQICTVESADHFSYRRDGLTGRQVGLVSL